MQRRSCMAGGHLFQNPAKGQWLSGLCGYNETKQTDCKKNNPPGGAPKRDYPAEISKSTHDIKERKYDYGFEKETQGVLHI